jgi:hypothetical protein
MSPIMTEAPSDASRSAVPAPIPVAPPATIAIFPSNRFMSVLPLAFQLYRTASSDKISEIRSAQPSIAIPDKKFQLKCISLSLG